MRQVYIDCGSNNGDTVRDFKKNISTFYLIHAFEPNPKFNQSLFKEGVSFLPKAVSTFDGETDFYLAGDDLSSTLVKDKTTGGVDYRHPIKVECIDFSRWLKDNFTKTDYIILKLDIEGAEYDVLEKMIEDGTINLIDQLWVEFHPNKVRSKTTTETNELIEKLKTYNLEFKKW